MQQQAASSAGTSLKEELNIEQSDLLPAGHGFVSCSRLPKAPAGFARGAGDGLGVLPGGAPPPLGAFSGKGAWAGAGGGGSRLRTKKELRAAAATAAAAAAAAG
jgi:hypothetical protein